MVDWLKDNFFLFKWKCSSSVTVSASKLIGNMLGVREIQNRFRKTDTNAKVHNSKEADEFRATEELPVVSYLRATK